MRATCPGMLLGIALMAVAPSAAAQTLTPAERAAFRRQTEERQAQFYTLLDRADAAWDREMAREKAGDCRSAATTYDVNLCMGSAVIASKANYKAYVGAFRAIFLLKVPWIGDRSGPSGTPLTEEESVAAFDATEATWEKYQQGMCGLAEGRDFGGTIAPYTGMRCQLQMIRSHMRELGGILGEGFHR